MQLVWTCVGLALFVAVLMVVRDHRALARYAYTLAAAGLAFLALPALLPARFSEVNGAKIWIRVAGFSIQPGEFAKIALIVFFAAYLVHKRDVLVAGQPPGRRHRPAPRPRPGSGARRLGAVAAGPRRRAGPRHARCCSSASSS